MFHFERQEACNEEPNSGRGRTVPTTWMEDGVLDPVGESFFALTGISQSSLRKVFHEQQLHLYHPYNVQAMKVDDLPQRLEFAS
jgi:hypothetical protein